MNLKIAVLEDKENDYRILESALKIWSEGSGNRIELFWYQTGNETMPFSFSSLTALFLKLL